jgi:general secretion pathway protein F
LMTFVVPQFIPLFEDAGQALPWLTQAVFGAANLLKQTWWIVICLVVVIAWIVDKQLQQAENRKKFDAWCLKLPLVGNLITHMETARLARTLGTLISNGVPLLQAVKLVEDVIGNEALREVMGTTHTELQKGRRLAKPLKESGLFPTLCVQLIEVGEESGNLESMLIKVANIYDTKLQTTVRRLLNVLEPVLILGLGAMIGIIIISILVAMLGLNDLVI